MGVTVAEEEVPVEVDRWNFKVATRWYKWLTTLVSDLPEDTTRPTKESILKRKATAAATRAAKRQRCRLKDAETWRDYPRHPVRPHRLFLEEGKVACTLCKKSALVSSQERSMRDLAKSLCTGDILSRRANLGAQGGVSAANIQEAAVVNPGQSMHAFGIGHVLWRAGDVYFCKKCWCYGQEKAKGLASQCAPTAASLATKQTIRKRLSEGRHPRSNIILGDVRKIGGGNTGF
jgi:hypothetical protein